MPPIAPRQRLLTTPLIVALVALATLAVATFWTVLSGDEAPTAGDSGAGNAAVSEDVPDDEIPEPAGTPMDAADSSFSTTVPEGFADGKDMVDDIDGLVLTLYDTATEDDGMPTHIIVATADDDGTEIGDAVEQIQSGFEDDYDTATEASDIAITEIDGEPTQGWQSSDYKDGATDVNSTQFVVVHAGTYYFFTVNSRPEHAQSGREALEHIMVNTTWS